MGMGLILIHVDLYQYIQSIKKRACQRVFLFMIYIQHFGQTQMKEKLTYDTFSGASFSSHKYWQDLVLSPNLICSCSVNVSIVL